MSGMGECDVKFPKNQFFKKIEDRTSKLGL